MQFKGHNHLETLIYQKETNKNLVFRNLSWSADEVSLRPRAEGFGEPDSHLTFSKADQVWAFFGFNESYAGKAGLENFKSQLKTWIQTTLAQKYNGHSAPKIVLITPIAAEALTLPKSLNSDTLNQQLELYANVMIEIAKEQQLTCIDLFHPSQNLFSAPHSQPLTINGVHLTKEGDLAIANLFYQALYSQQAPAINSALHHQVQEKNILWYERYRFIDSFYVYGGRSQLKFADGEQTNHDVLEREREILDAMVAQHDQRISTVAQGQSLPKDLTYQNLPAHLPVKTYFGDNLPKDEKSKNMEEKLQTSKGAEPDSAKIPSVAESKTKLTASKDFSINNFASEEDFPDLANAVTMTFDRRGRLWVVVIPSYPQWKPGDLKTDKIIILEDTNQDGKADTCKTFVDQLNIPLSFEFYQDGIILAHQRNLIFLQDTNGDDIADKEEILLSGFDSADSHHTINAVTYGPEGDLYFQEGTFHHSQVETPYGPIRCVDAGTYRFNPNTHELSVFISYPYANPHGFCFNIHGQAFISDSSPGSNFYGSPISGYLPYPEKHSILHKWFPKRVRPTSGGLFVTSPQFPDDMQGDFLLNNCIAVQGTLRHKVNAEGSDYIGKEIDPLLMSTESTYRPVDLKFGPDGCLYIIDWAEALIGHMQYSIRDPLRDHKHGRIWRIKYDLKDTTPWINFSKLSIPDLIPHIHSTSLYHQIQAKKELSLRPRNDVLAALNQEQKQNPDKGLTILWAKHFINAAASQDVLPLLKSTTALTRAAAIRYLSHYPHHLNSLSLFEPLVTDTDPTVRLEVARACSYFAHVGKPEIFLNAKLRKEAIALLLKLLEQPTDKNIDYTINESFRALRPSPAELPNTLSAKLKSIITKLITIEDLRNDQKTEWAQLLKLQHPSANAIDIQQACQALQTLMQSKDLWQFLTQIDFNTFSANARQKLQMHIIQQPLNLTPELAQQLEATLKTNLHQDIKAAIIAASFSAAPDRSQWLEKMKVSALNPLIASAPLIFNPQYRSELQPFFLNLLNELKTPNLNSLVELIKKTPDETLMLLITHLPSTSATNPQAAFNSLAQLKITRSQFPTLIQSISTLPQTAWSKDMIPSLAKQYLINAKKLNDKQRATPTEAKLNQNIATLLNFCQTEETNTLLQEVKTLHVPIFVINTVKEQMRFDSTKLEVAPNTPMEIHFNNMDIMPHNLVLVSPNKHTEIGTLAQSMQATDAPDGYAYVPKSPDVIQKTKMLEPGQNQILRFTSPSTPGDYEFVCTFPGHWIIMWGVLQVK
jgi:glucose/arabinose dehydrogenase/azurin